MYSFPTALLTLENDLYLLHSTQVNYKNTSNFLTVMSTNTIKFLIFNTWFLVAFYKAYSIKTFLPLYLPGEFSLPFSESCPQHICSLLYPLSKGCWFAYFEQPWAAPKFPVHFLCYRQRNFLNNIVKNIFCYKSKIQAEGK